MRKLVKMANTWFLEEINLLKPNANGPTLEMLESRPEKETEGGDKLTIKY